MNHRHQRLARDYPFSARWWLLPVLVWASVVGVVAWLALSVQPGDGAPATAESELSEPLPPVPLGA